jgi:tetratricopeptide (TPR) repeat protein
MFGFFDKIKNKRQAGLDEFASKMQSDPAFKRTWILGLERVLVNQVTSLRDAGNFKKAEEITKEFLKPYLSTFAKTRNPEDLQIISETLRGASLPESAVKLLESVLSRSESDSMDKTIIYCELALSLYQTAAPEDKIYQAFDNAISSVPPNGSTHVASNGIKASVAFYGLQYSIFRNNTENETRYSKIIYDYMPSFSKSENDIKILKSNFVGFIQSQSAVLPISKELLATPKKGKNDFHMCVKIKDGGSSEDMNSWLITARCYADHSLGVSNRYSIEWCGKPDIVTFFEAQSALYWRESFDNGDISIEQAVRWLRDIEVRSGCLFFKKDITIVNEVALYSALTKASVQYVVVNMDSIDVPDSARKWYRENSMNEHAWNRKNLVAAALVFKEAVDASLVDNQFLYHLSKSVSPKK